VLAAALGACVSACLPASTRAPGAPRACGVDGVAQLEGFDPSRLHAALTDFARSPINYHGLVVQRHGRLVGEVYRRGRDAPLDATFPTTTTFDACTLHDVRSISKSVTSLCWGIAAGQGKTPPLETRALDLYPELAHLKTGGREAITLAHLLTMTSGLEWNEENYGTLTNVETGLFFASSQARHTFDRPMAAPPGTKFNYNGGCTAVIAELLARYTGTSLPAFAPLGIDDWRWANDYRNRPLSFAGLRMRPRDLARIGRMMLDGGLWEGRQVVLAAWVADSIRPHIETGDGLRYGYFWWLGEVEALGARHAYAAGFGNGGQRLFMVPGLDLVVVITAGNYNGPAGRKSQDVFRQVAAAVGA
jgi:CubicO group peptidase (beta-lactamase class C family)